MGWGTNADAVREQMPPDCEILTVPETGQFVHIERPHDVARPVPEFLS